MSDAVARQIVNVSGYIPMLSVKKVKEIAAGWYYLLFRKEQIEMLALERVAICSSCSHNTGTKCGLCGCPLQAKMRSPDSTCPGGKWKR